MAIVQVSGTISLDDLNKFFGWTTPIGLNSPAVRSLVAKPSGTIAMTDAYGTSATIINLTISAHTLNYNLRSAIIAAGWDQVSRVIGRVTINSGIYVYSSSTATPAFTTGAALPAGSYFELVNNGLICGMGGIGGNGGASSGAGGAGGTGGVALQVLTQLHITNNNVIAGGGGGGGGGGGYASQYVNYGAGGGGGAQTGLTNTSGGAGGGGASGGGGAGGTGTSTARAGGGAGGTNGSVAAGAGGAGGTWGAAGGAGGGSSYGGGAGGAGGNCVTGSTSIIWLTIGTRYGGIV